MELGKKDYYFLLTADNGAKIKITLSFPFCDHCGLLNDFYSELSHFHKLFFEDWIKRRSECVFFAFDSHFEIESQTDKRIKIKRLFTLRGGKEVLCKECDFDIFDARTLKILR